MCFAAEAEESLVRGSETCGGEEEVMIRHAHDACVRRRVSMMPHLGLLSVSRHTYTAAHTIPFESNVFIFETADSMATFLKRLNREQQHALKAIAVVGQ